MQEVVGSNHNRDISVLGALIEDVDDLCQGLHSGDPDVIQTHGLVSAELFRGE